MNGQKDTDRRRKDQRRIPLSMRITPTMRDWLVSKARVNGRSISQEAELLLEYAVKDDRRIENILDLLYGPPLAGLLMALGQAMDTAGRAVCVVDAIHRAEGNIVLSSALSLSREFGKWINDPNAFNQAVKAALTVLEAMLPEGGYPIAVEVDPQEVYPPIDVTEIDPTQLHNSAAYGHGTAIAVLKGIANPEMYEREPLLKRRGSIIGERLGPEIVARIAARMSPRLDALPRESEGEPEATP